MLIAPAARYIAELDATCAPPPKCATRLTYYGYQTNYGY